MGNIVLHIGTHKTATSSLQLFLHENSKALKESGIVYPQLDESKAHHSLLLKWFDIHSKACGRQTKSANQLWAEVVNLCNTTSDTVVVSSEEFSRIGLNQCDPAEIRDLLHSHNVRIVVYLRRQDLFLESCYNQIRKAHLNAPEFKEFIENDFAGSYLEHLPLDYHTLIDRWSSAFGTQSMIVKIFDKSLFVNESIYEDFLSILSDDRSLCKNLIKRSSSIGVNESYPPAVLDAYSRLKPRGAFVRAKHGLKKKLNKLITCRKGSFMSPSQRERILELSRTSNNEVARKYLGANVSDLAQEDMLFKVNGVFPPEFKPVSERQLFFIKYRLIRFRKYFS